MSAIHVIKAGTARFTAYNVKPIAQCSDCPDETSTQLLAATFVKDNPPPPVLILSPDRVETPDDFSGSTTDRTGT